MAGKKGSKGKKSKKGSKRTGGAAQQLALLQASQTALEGQLQAIAAGKSKSKPKSKSKSKPKSGGASYGRRADGKLKKGFTVDKRTGKTVRAGSIPKKPKPHRGPSPSQLAAWQQAGAVHVVGPEIPTKRSTSKKKTEHVKGFDRQRRRPGYYHVQPYFSAKLGKEMPGYWQRWNNNPSRQRALSARRYRGKFIGAHANPAEGIYGAGPLGLDLKGLALFTVAGIGGFATARALRVLAAERLPERARPYADLIGPTATILAAIFAVPRVGFLRGYQGPLLAGAAAALGESLVNRYGSRLPASVSRYVAPAGSPAAMSDWNAYERAMGDYEALMSSDRPLLPADFDVSGALSGTLTDRDLGLGDDYVDSGQLGSTLTDRDLGLGDDYVDSGQLGSTLTDRDLGLGDSFVSAPGLGQDEDFDEEDLFEELESAGLGAAATRAWQGKWAARVTALSRHPGKAGRVARALAKVAPKGATGTPMMPASKEAAAELVKKVATAVAAEVGEPVKAETAREVVEVMKAASPTGQIAPPATAGEAVLAKANLPAAVLSPVELQYLARVKAGQAAPEPGGQDEFGLPELGGMDAGGIYSRRLYRLGGEE